MKIRIRHGFPAPKLQFPLNSAPISPSQAPLFLPLVLQYSLQPGSVLVRPVPSPLSLFGAMKGPLESVSRVFCDKKGLQS